MKTRFTELTLTAPEARPEEKAKPLATRALDRLNRVGEQFKHYKDHFNDPQQRRLLGLQATAYATWGATVVTQSMPLVSQTLFATYALVDLIKLVERGRAFDHGKATSADLIADAASVALDFTCLLFPPAGWLYALTSARDVRQAYQFLADNPPQPKPPDV